MSVKSNPATASQADGSNSSETSVSLSATAPHIRWIGLLSPPNGGRTGKGMASDVLRRIREAAPLIRAEAAASEADGRLTGAVVEAMRDAGVFGMTMSKELGGLELSPPEQIEVLEALSAADGSAGWCGM